MIIKILGLAVISNLFAHWFRPIQGPKNWILNRIFPNTLFGKLVQELGNCSKCVGLWFSFVVLQDILAASLVSFIAYIFNHIIDRVEEWYQ